MFISSLNLPQNLFQTGIMIGLDQHLIIIPVFDKSCHNVNKCQILNLG